MAKLSTRSPKFSAENPATSVADIAFNAWLMKLICSTCASVDVLKVGTIAAKLPATGWPFLTATSALDNSCKLTAASINEDKSVQNISSLLPPSLAIASATACAAPGVSRFCKLLNAAWSFLSLINLIAPSTAPLVPSLAALRTALRSVIFLSLKLCAFAFAVNPPTSVSPYFLASSICAGILKLKAVPKSLIICSVTLLFSSATSASSIWRTSATRAASNGEAFAKIESFMPASVAPKL